MKRKKTNWANVPWTPFERMSIPTDPINQLDPCTAMFRNSRYHVTVWMREHPEPFGLIAHLSFKVHDRQPYHDWRDMQRIKNEICGPEFDAVEIYPAEAKLVDTANQYHLFVFRTLKLPFGFQERLVGDGKWDKSVQRPWRDEDRPADCVGSAEYQTILDDAITRRKGNTDVVQAVGSSENYHAGDIGAPKGS